ncbi:hypothetical protein JCM13580A_43510 [Streptomyces drozdowiczii]|uniref:hypothetical protein n=1 Tax=Streptomyces drozdowiczii TaxID=202862 RepID=UPI0031EB7135
MGRSKHLISAFTITAAGAALLTGCSSDDPDTDAAGPAASPPAAAASAYGTGTQNLLVGDWKVDTEKALVSPENGKEVQAWRVTNARDPDRTAGPRERRTQQACSA